MKRLILPAGVILCVLATSVFAVDTTDYSKPGMQQFAHQMNEMQQCMSGVDEIEYNRIQTQLNTLDNLLPELCHAKEYAKIQSKMQGLADNLQNSKAFSKIQTCTAPLRASGFMPDFPLLAQITPKAIEQLCQKYPN